METTANQNQSYKKSVLVQISQQKAFSALTEDIDKWWGKTDGNIEKKGDVFKVSWGEPWYQFKIIEYKVNSNITWECVDANQIITGLENVQKEWVGTKLYWNIDCLNDNRVKINLHHVGLIPTDICYDTCSNAWNHFIGYELKRFLEKN